MTNWLQMEPEVQDVLTAFLVERFAMGKFYSVRGRLQKEAYIVSDKLFHDGKRVHAYLDLGAWKTIIRELSRRAVNTDALRRREQIDFREVVLGIEDDSGFLRRLKQRAAANAAKFTATSNGVSFTPIEIERFVMARDRMLARVGRKL